MHAYLDIAIDGIPMIEQYLERNIDGREKAV